MHPTPRNATPTSATLGPLPPAWGSRWPWRKSKAPVQSFPSWASSWILAFLLPRLPPEKLSTLQSLLASWSHKRVCRRQELKSLLGHLHHAAKVVYPGRSFLRRLTDLLHGTHSQSHFIRLNHHARADLLWWSSFLRDWKGTSFFISPHWSHLSYLQVSTDAAGATGFGAYLDGLWFAGRWLPEQLSASIAFKELYPIVVPAHVWGHQWQGLQVQFLCDNHSVTDAISKRFCSAGALGVFCAACS